MKEAVSGCPLEETMRVLGGRWRIVLVYYLLEGRKRFSELRRGIPLISPGMLARVIHGRSLSMTITWQRRLAGGFATRG